MQFYPGKYNKGNESVRGSFENADNWLITPSIFEQTHHFLGYKL
jgi:hypothetical protein